MHMQVHPCDGDWFGGVSAANAAAFLDALLGVEVGCGGVGRALGWTLWDVLVCHSWRPHARVCCLTPPPAPQLDVDGGAGDPALRPFWRGRMGLGKGQQLALFEQVGGGRGAGVTEGRQGVHGPACQPCEAACALRASLPTLGCTAPSSHSPAGRCDPGPRRVEQRR